MEPQPCQSWVVSLKNVVRSISKKGIRVNNRQDNKVSVNVMLPHKSTHVHKLSQSVDDHHCNDDKVAFCFSLERQNVTTAIILKGSLWSLIGVRNKNNYSEDTFVHNLGVFAHIQVRAPDICVRFGPNVISCTWHRLGEAFCGRDVTQMSVHTSHLAYINWTWSSNQSYLRVSAMSHGQIWHAREPLLWAKFVPNKHRYLDNVLYIL